MPRIVDYEIECGSTMDDIASTVREAISDGWQPIGGVSVLAQGGYTYYFQALAKYEEVANA